MIKIKYLLTKLHLGCAGWGNYLAFVKVQRPSAATSSQAKYFPIYASHSFNKLFNILLCFQTWQGLYLSGVVFLTVISLAFQFHPSFLTSRWASRRLLLFCSLVAYGIGPSLHWVLLLGGWNDYSVRVCDDHAINL